MGDTSLGFGGVVCLANSGTRMVMSWKGHSTEDSGVDLIRDYETGDRVIELAEINHVSGRTIYTWLDRHAAEVIAGLADGNPGLWG